MKGFWGCVLVAAMALAGCDDAEAPGAAPEPGAPAKVAEAPKAPGEPQEGRAAETDEAAAVAEAENKAAEVEKKAAEAEKKAAEAEKKAAEAEKKAAEEALAREKLLAEAAKRQAEEAERRAAEAEKKAADLEAEKKAAVEKARAEAEAKAKAAEEAAAKAKAEEEAARAEAAAKRKAAEAKRKKDEAKERAKDERARKNAHSGRVRKVSAERAARKGKGMAKAAAGLWLGEFKSKRFEGEVIGIITPDGETQLWASTGVQLGGWLEVSGDGEGGKLSGKLEAYISSSRRQTYELKATVSAGKEIKGTFSTRGDSGTFTLGFDEDYQQEVGLAGVSGGWAAKGVGMSVDGSGKLAGRDAIGCIYSGSLAGADGKRNVFELTLNLTGCRYRGSYTGLASLTKRSSLGDKSGKQRLAYAIHNDKHALAGFLSPRATKKRPRKGK